VTAVTPVEPLQEHLGAGTPIQQHSRVIRNAIKETSIYTHKRGTHITPDNAPLSNIRTPLAAETWQQAIYIINTHNTRSSLLSYSTLKTALHSSSEVRLFSSGGAIRDHDSGPSGASSVGHTTRR
jgi:hypothetical protein